MLRAARGRGRGLVALLRPAMDASPSTLSSWRGWAADAAPLPSSSSGDEADPATMRRLAEMEAAGAWPAPPPPRPAWPSPADAARFLSGGTASSSSTPSSSSSSTPTPLPTLPWPEAVRLARGAGLENADPLVDGFGRRHTYLRLSLTEKCNLRCAYCMPAEGVALTPRPHLLTRPELARLARLFVGAGVTKVRLTGGEPTVRPDVEGIASDVSSIPGVEAVCLTTNGVNLAGGRVAGLAAAGVTHWNISLDSLRPARFAALTRRDAKLHAGVLDTIAQVAALPNLGAPVKVNVVLVRGVNDDEVGDFARFAVAAGVNVRFIEYMPFARNDWDRERVVPWAEAFEAASSAVPGGLVRVADPAGEVAKNFVPAAGGTQTTATPATHLPVRLGSVSFVTSMTESFCSGCNRVRLLADGALKVCLFGAGEVSLRDAVREGATDEELRLVVAAALSRKKAAHAGLATLAGLPNREMVRIGG